MKQFVKVAGRLASVVTLTLVLAVIAHAQNDTITPDPYETSKEPVYPTPQADRALLYVARPDHAILFGLETFKVFVDDKAAGWLPQRSYLAVQVEPGERLIWGPSRNEAQRFDLEAGKTYLLVLAEKYRTVNTGRSSYSVLDATWWVVRHPEEIKNLVPAAKLKYATTMDESMAELNKEAAKKFEKTNAKAHYAMDVALPMSFEKVMYRRAKKEFSLKTWEDTGMLTIGRESIEFKGDKMTVVVPMKDLRWFAYDTIVSKTVGVLFNRALGEAQWNILSIMSEGQEQTIAFKDGRRLSDGSETKRIYRALQAAAPEKAQSSAKAAAAVAALADNSPQTAAAGENQPSVPEPAQEAKAETKLAALVPQSAAAPSSANVSTIVIAREGSFGSPLLQRDTLRMISVLDNAEPPDCDGVRRVLKMEITKEPAGVKIKHNRAVSGWWEERWTIDRCGTQRIYSITYRNDSRGEVDFGAGMVRTLGSQALRDDTLKAISALDGPMAPDCKTERRVFTSEVSRLPDGVKVEANRMVAGWWEERWTINRCQVRVAYDVTYRADGRGGTDISPRGALEQEKKTDTATPPPQPAAGENPPPAAAPSQPPASGALPDGFVLFEERKDQFTIAIPKDWTAYDQSRLLGEQQAQKRGGMFNVIIFYRAQDPPSNDGMSVEIMRKIDVGEVPSFFVQKMAAEKGMSCDGFSEKAGKQVVKLLGLDGSHWEPSPVAGCKGVRVRGSGGDRKQDVYAASDGRILYLFYLRMPAEKFEQNAEVFQKSVATAKLTAAK